MENLDSIHGNTILLVQAQKPGLAQAEREAIWSVIGQPTRYHNFLEHKHSVQLNGITHLIFGSSEVNISDGEQVWFPEARRLIRRCDRETIPFLGICFGMQFLAYTYGARIARQSEEIGRVKIQRNSQPSFFDFLPQQFEANTAHLESIWELPTSFLNLGQSQSCSVQMICHRSKPLLGVQFHPAMNQNYIQAIQNATRFEALAVCQAAMAPAKDIITQFCQLSSVKKEVSSTLYDSLPLTQEFLSSSLTA